MCIAFFAQHIFEVQFICISNLFLVIAEANSTV